jgi:hypothetical protein
MNRIIVGNQEFVVGFKHGNINKVVQSRVYPQQQTSCFIKYGPLGSRDCEKMLIGTGSVSRDTREKVDNRVYARTESLRRALTDMVKKNPQLTGLDASLNCHINIRRKETV